MEKVLQVLTEFLLLLAASLLVEAWLLQRSIGEPGIVVWLPILFVAAQYGLIAGLSAYGSVTALFFVIYGWPEAATFDVRDNFVVRFEQPIAWGILALLVGAFVSRHIQRATATEAALDRQRAEAEALSRAYGETVQRNRVLQNRIALEDLPAERATIMRHVEVEAKDLADSLAALLQDRFGFDAFRVHLQNGSARKLLVEHVAANEVPRFQAVSLWRVSGPHGRTFGMIELPADVLDPSDEDAAIRLNSFCCELGNALHQHGIAETTSPAFRLHNRRASDAEAAGGAN